jgi:UDP-N-acetylmuramate dehydrogenase
LFTSDFAGTILCPKIRGIRIVKQEGNEIVISAGAGVDWDKLVEWTVDKGFGGLENLSLIPGNVGATPVQNIGAYGAEAKDTIVKVVALDKNDGSRHEFSNSECEFGYRESIFKKKYKGRYLVIRVYFRLSVNPTLKLEYGSLKEEVQKLGGATLKNVRQAVINIRRSKLPDPEIIANAGSFFKNPVVDNSVALDLKKSYPGLPCFDDPSGGTKLAAGWMIEQCGWKGKRIGDAGVHDKQSLVLVNHGKATGKEIFYLSEKIKSSVSEKFGIDLEREVEVIGTI